MKRKRPHKELKVCFTAPAIAYVYHRDDDNVIHISTLAQPWQKWRAVVHVGVMMHWEWFRTKKEAVRWINKWRGR